MLKNPENIKPLRILSLDAAYKEGNAERCYEILASTPTGIRIYSQNIIFQLVNPLVEEEELMEKSKREEREYGFVKSAKGTEIIKGEGLGIDPDTVSAALCKLANPVILSIFSHSHWDTTVHPLPSQGIFGDVLWWNIFRNSLPNLDCRVSYNQGEQVRAIRYHGYYEK